MTLVLILFLVFIATVALALALFYFVIEEPTERRRMKQRLEALEQSIDSGGSEGEALLREAVLSKLPRLNAFLLQFPPIVKLHILLRQADSRLTVARLIMVASGLWGLTLVLAVGLRFPFQLALVFACFAAAIPFAYIAVQKQRRLAKFAEQFPDAIELLARAVRAGHAFTTGLDLIAKELSEPVATEFRTVYDQQNLGLSVRDALANLSVRVPLPDVRIFVTALQVQRESGGNLAEILDNLSTVIRERFKLLRQVQVITAEGRLSLYTLTALPFLAGILFFLVNRDYMLPLFTDPLGQRMIAGALVLQVLGYVVISKIVRIKV
jgi:tight adherence protein B